MRLVLFLWTLPTNLVGHLVGLLLTRGLEPELKGVTPPGVKADAGLTATGADHVLPPSSECDT